MWIGDISNDLFQLLPESRIEHGRAIKQNENKDTTSLYPMKSTNSQRKRVRKKERKRERKRERENSIRKAFGESFHISETFFLFLEIN